MVIPTIGGLPAHPLIVHATVVLVTLGATAVPDGLLPRVIGLLVVAVLLAVRIGHSGAKASWSHVASTANR